MRRGDQAKCREGERPPLEADATRPRPEIHHDAAARRGTMTSSTFEKRLFEQIVGPVANHTDDRNPVVDQGDGQCFGFISPGGHRPSAWM